MSRPRLRRTIGLVAMGSVVLTVVGRPLLTVQFWLVATFLGGFILVMGTITPASPDDSSSDDHSEA